MPSVLKSRVRTPLTREDKKESPKLIVISGEGPVTEEIYFYDILASICSPIKERVRIVSARERFYELDPTQRTQSDIDSQNESQPRQVMQRMDNYLSSQKYIQSSKSEDDEYWLVLDVDDHTDEHHIEEWNSVLSECEARGYKYAVSNPFFEVWLLLHHRDAIDIDKSFEVTLEKPYKSTSYFKKELQTIRAPLKGVGKKEPQLEHYSLSKIRTAIIRAKNLHNKEGEFREWPHILGSTVYILAESIISLMPETTN